MLLASRFSASPHPIDLRGVSSAKAQLRKLETADLVAPTITKNVKVGQPPVFPPHSFSIEISQATYVDPLDFRPSSSHLPNRAVAVARYPDVRSIKCNPIGNVDVSEFPDDSAIAAPHFHNQRKLRYPDVHSVKRDEP